jgi:hypothetical protein
MYIISARGFLSLLTVSHCQSPRTFAAYGPVGFLLTPKHPPHFIHPEHSKCQSKRISLRMPDIGDSKQSTLISTLEWRVKGINQSAYISFRDFSLWPSANCPATRRKLWKPKWSYGLRLRALSPNPKINNTWHGWSFGIPNSAVHGLKVLTHPLQSYPQMLVFPPCHRRKDHWPPSLKAQASCCLNFK